MFGLKIFPEQASTAATQVDTLFFFMLGISALMVILIAGTITLFVVKYRRRAEDEIPVQIEGSNRLEFAWSIIPLGMFMVFFVWGAGIYLNNAQPPANSEQIYVVAKQWMWKFEHEGGQQEINALHIPVGRPVKLVMTSQDVIHSFFVPDFRIKQDVLPDRYTTAWFQATKTGEYHLFCSQYCGLNHAEMTGTVTVMDPAAYEQWLAGGPTSAGAAPGAATPSGATASQSTAAQGQALFQQLGCSSCHDPAGHGPGPSLVGVYGSTVHLQGGGTVVADDAYVRESILNPTAKIVQGFAPIMPSFSGRLTEQQILALIAYIQSIGSSPETSPGATTPGAPTPGAIPVTPGPSPTLLVPATPTVRP